MGPSLDAGTDAGTDAATIPRPLAARRDDAVDRA
jgi:hypothetical protein